MTNSCRILAAMTGWLIWIVAAGAEPAASDGKATDLKALRIDKIEWPAALRGHAFIPDFEATLKAGQPTPQRAVEHVLELIGQLPGFSVDDPKFKRARRTSNTATFMPAATFKPYEAVLRSEVHASRDQPAYQQSGWLQLNNMLRLNEQLTLIGTNVRSDSDAQALGLGYRQVLTSGGLNLVFNAGHARGKVGMSVEIEGFRDDIVTLPLQSRFLEAGLRQPLVMSKDLIVFATAVIYANDAQTDPFPQTFYQDRLRGIRASLDGRVEALGGSTDFNIILDRGFIGLGSTGNNNPFASIASGRADHTDVEATAIYTRPLPDHFSFAFGFDVQYAFTPLLAPQQCSYGGRIFGRAYRVDQLTGDHCIDLGTELRRDIPLPVGDLSKLQIYAFADYGDLTNIAPNPGTAAHIHAASAGAGMWMRWQDKVTMHLWSAKGIDGPYNGWRTLLSMAAHF